MTSPLFALTPAAVGWISTVVAGAAVLAMLVALLVEGWRR